MSYIDDGTLNMLRSNHHRLYQLVNGVGPIKDRRRIGWIKEEIRMVYDAMLPLLDRIEEDHA